MERAAVSIAGKVGQVLVHELQDIRGVGDKVVHLRDELATMNAALRIISEAEQSSVDHLVREWEKQVDDLAYDAEDCTDTYTLRNIRPTQRPSIYARAKRIARYPYKKLVLQRALAADIKDLLARTTTVSERRIRYGIDRAVLPRAAWFAPVSATSISANALCPTNNPEHFVGITEQANALADKIKAIKAPVHEEDEEIKASVHDQHEEIKEPIHDDDAKSLKVFSIVGFGGLGKTTLAMELCRQLDADFPCQAQVSVSQAFDARKDMKGLLVRVLKQMLKGKADSKPSQTNNEEVAQIDKMNVEELSSKIKELLSHRRCLIVIDDVWSLPSWEAIHNRLPKDNCGSGIIVTTRVKAVAKAASVSKDFVHHMEPLKLEASEKLFVKRVFGSTEKGDCPSELKQTMDTILRKCGGLPLAIVSISSLLPSSRSAESIDMWERVSRSIGSHMESHPNLEGMRQLITLSYDYLPHYLKPCMMYMSIFPEDYVIAKDRLLYRWIAEGLVTERRGLTLLEVAEEYFNELISRNMIQPQKLVLSGAEVDGCRMHDMVLEVMVSKSQESNFVRLVGRQYGVMPHGHGKVRRLSMHDNDHDEIHHARHGVEVMKLQNVRSLTTFQCDYGLDKLLDRLGEFKLLRVLDLEDCKAIQDKHMRDVCRLYLLRFLSLKGTNVSKMPHKVGNLEHLETLDIKDTFIVRELPQTVTKLSKLERLRSGGWLLPRGLGNMKALREVDTGVLDGVDVPWVTQEIGELPRLQVLSIRIESNYQKDEFIQESLPKLATSLSNTSTLRSLNLVYWGNGSSLEFLLGVTTSPPLLQSLRLYGTISQLPDWISSLTHLTKFEVGCTALTGDQLFDVLCKLPNLQSVHLWRIKCKDRALVARPKHSFPVLKILKVVRCPIMLTFEAGSMAKLETLVLGFGYSVEMSIVGVQNLENLQEVNLLGDKHELAMERAVEQLRTLSDSNQIKVVADWR